MNFLTPSDEPEYEPTFDFSHPEDVFIEVDYDEVVTRRGGWERFAIVHAIVIPNGDVTGAASYECEYGGFLNYTLEAILDEPEKVGFYVVQGVTGVYTHGDGYTTDDDMDFYYEGIRPATDEEVRDYFG